jgi:hypothetical protein
MLYNYIYINQMECTKNAELKSPVRLDNQSVFRVNFTQQQLYVCLKFEKSALYIFLETRKN